MLRLMCCFTFVCVWTATRENSCGVEPCNYLYTYFFYDMTCLSTRSNVIPSARSSSNFVRIRRHNGIVMGTTSLSVSYKITLRKWLRTWRPSAGCQMKFTHCTFFVVICSSRYVTQIIDSIEQHVAYLNIVFFPEQMFLCNLVTTSWSSSEKHC